MTASSKKVRSKEDCMGTLTKGKTYTVIYECDEYYNLESDMGTTGGWLKERFEEVVEPTAAAKPAHTGLRHNTGKIRLDLIPPEWLWALGDILTKGSIKYAARNWEGGLSYTDTVGCLMRHLTKWLAGERYDVETGCHHMGMVAWNALVLMTFDLRKIGTNDLPPVGMDVLNSVNNGQGTQQQQTKG